MAKNVAVLAVNPVNGHGLFSYLEPFFENGIQYTVFAVSDEVDIKTNSGLALRADDLVANLKSRKDEFDALVFACGDAVPKLNDNLDKQYNRDMLEVIELFAREGKIMIGHCGAGLLFDQSGAAEGKKLSAHPYIRSLIKNAAASEKPVSVDGNYYTAENENSIHLMIDRIVEALR